MWKGSETGGRGVIKFEGKQRYTNQVAFRLTFGYYPKLACHTCDEGLCCNPEHLYEGTYTSNNRDTITRNRGNRAKGENVGTSKLTVNDIENIRKDKRVQWIIAQEYGISQMQVSRIKRYIEWKYIDDRSEEIKNDLFK